MLPVLWLCGLPGVGKSTIGFGVYQRILEFTLCQIGTVQIDADGKTVEQTADAVLGVWR
ncbi:hypothetical protein [Actinocrispum sp. NPDC049592]|uniref:hypothetical protein n=1 Tax=Actinocrispum sp. NPDC049592 TaxID=3154835 RepID=UPI00343965DA